MRGNKKTDILSRPIFISMADTASLAGKARFHRQAWDQTAYLAGVNPQPLLNTIACRYMLAFLPHKYRAGSLSMCLI